MSPAYTAEQWLQAYARAWREHNLELAADLWTEEVSYSFDPFGPPMVGRNAVVEYWRQALAHQSQTELHIRLWSAWGEHAAAEWWVTFWREGKFLTLSASLLLRFAPDGRCCELHEHWLEYQGKLSTPSRFVLARIIHEADKEAPRRVK